MGTQVVDQEAKDTLDDRVSNCSIPYSDFKPFMINYILKRWKDSWNQHIHKIPCSYGQKQPDVVLDIVD
jgi:hypothetical protein